MQSNPQHIELGFSPDAQAQRQAELLAVLRQTAPEIISDNQIDIDKLKQLIGEERIAPAEHYELTWAGKAAARREIQKTTSHTLLPAANNPAQAPHMLIEGENLEVLRVLQKSYHGKVKMIYIDPPYNTGSDSFVYPDDYSETLEEYLKRTGEKNEAGYLNKQSLWKKNSKESGQYHSAWLSMMYPRLYMARNLLCDDGLLFVSCDDNEVHNLRSLLNEIYGDDNFVSQIVWKKSYGGGSKVKHVVVLHEYVLCYAKNKNSLEKIELPPDPKVLKYYKFKDEKFDVRGPFRLQPLATTSMDERENLRFPILHEGQEVWPEKQWQWSQDRVISAQLNNELSIVKVKGYWSVNYKQYLRDENGVERGAKPFSVLDGPYTQTGTDEIKQIFGDGKVFPYPKPRGLIRHFMDFCHADQNALILDFFAGSGTTAHAVMEVNLEDGGRRQCISIQMPEVLDEGSEACKAGYRTIADITRARIDKVIAKLKAEHPDQTADLACAHFTLAPSNFKVWRSDVTDVAALRETLELFQTAEKTATVTNDAAAQTAMLAELLLKQGLGALGVHAISKPLQLAGVTVHRVLLNDDKQLWLCFEPYNAALKEEIVKARPAQLVLLNSCFVGDKADELLSNLQLELAGLDIGLTVI